MGPFSQESTTGLSFLIDTDYQGGLRSLLQGGLRCPGGSLMPWGAPHLLSVSHQALARKTMWQLYPRAMVVHRT